MKRINGTVLVALGCIRYSILFLPLLLTFTVQAASPTSAQVQQVLDQWLAAQNEGRFDTYAGLYAKSFSGTRRSGNIRRSFNREDWLLDRSKMFQKKMTVTISDVKITPQGWITEVRFIQDWASGSYHDIGTKQMRLQFEGKDVQIVWEELMNSRLIPPASAGCPPLKPDSETNEGTYSSSTRQFQSFSDNKCLVVTVTDGENNDGEFASYEWSASAELLQNGLTIDSESISKQQAEKIEYISSTRKAVSIDIVTGNSCFGEGYATQTTLSHTFSIKGDRILVQKVEGSSEFVHCPPHPEGLPGCVFSCQMARYEAVSGCKDPVSCDQAKADYDATHEPCPDDCSEPSSNEQ